MHGQDAVQVLHEVWKVILQACVTMDTNSPKYNVFYHQIMAGSILQAFAVHPDWTTQLLISSQALEKFLTVIHQLVSTI